MAQGQFAMEGKCPSPNLTASQRERHFPYGWGHFDSICPPEGVIAPFCHCMGAFYHGRGTKGSMCHFMTDRGQFAMEKAQLLGGHFVMRWGHFVTENHPLQNSTNTSRKELMCVGGLPSHAKCPKPPTQHGGNHVASYNRDLWCARHGIVSLKHCDCS